MNVASWLASVLLLMFISGTQPLDSRYSNQAFAGTKLLFQEQLDVKRKGLDVTYSYNEIGKLTKIVIKTNRLEEKSKLPEVINRDELRSWPTPN